MTSPMARTEPEAGGRRPGRAARSSSWPSRANGAPTSAGALPGPRPPARRTPCGSSSARWPATSSSKRSCCAPRLGAAEGGSGLADGRALPTSSADDRRGPGGGVGVCPMRSAIRATTSAPWRERMTTVATEKVEDFPMVLAARDRGLGPGWSSATWRTRCGRCNRWQCARRCRAPMLPFYRLLAAEHGYRVEGAVHHSGAVRMVLLRLAGLHLPRRRRAARRPGCSTGPWPDCGQAIRGPGLDGPGPRGDSCSDAGDDQSGSAAGSTGAWPAGGGRHEEAADDRHLGERLGPQDGAPPPGRSCSGESNTM